MGFGVSVVLGVAVFAGAGCPIGITIGVAAEFSLPPPLLPLLSTPPFMTFVGGQDKSVGGQFVFSLADEDAPSPLPIFVTSFVFVLLLLLSALAGPAEASATTATNTPAAAARRPLFIGSGYRRRR
jgi:hypothetical protein